MSNMFCRSKLFLFHGLVATAMVAVPMTASATSPPAGSHIPSNYILWDTFAPLGQPERQPGMSLSGTRGAGGITFESGRGNLASDHDWRFTENETIELFSPSTGRQVAASWLHHEEEFAKYADHRIFQSHLRIEMNENTRRSTVSFGKQDVHFWHGSVRFSIEPALNVWRVRVAEEEALSDRQSFDWHGDLSNVETELDANSIYNMGFEMDTRNLTATGTVNGEILFKDLDLTKGGEIDFGRVVFDWERFRNAHFGVEDAVGPGVQIHEVAANIIPEPASLGLVGLGSLLLAMRRRAR